MNIKIELKKNSSCGRWPQFTAEAGGVRWTFKSRNAGTVDDLENEALQALGFWAIRAGRGADSSPVRFGSDADFVEFTN